MAMDLNHLTEAERDAILAVLSKDESLRKKENHRIKTLKEDVKRLKMRGVIRPGQDAEKTCARCRQTFGWIFNKGQPCPLCRHKVCEKCKEVVEGRTWLCVLCYKQKELEVMSGNWFRSKFRKSKRNKKTNQVITGPELVRASIKTRPVPAEGSTTVAEEVKRVLSNNNTSPKSQRSTSPLEELSDTQSQADATSPRRSKRAHDSDEAAFPQETDRALLLELIRPKRSNGPIPENRVDIKRVSSARYKDSDSSSGSEASSPQMSSRQDSAFTHSDSLRSSMRSQTSSIPSSEGRMTIVTDTGSQLDYPTADTQSWLEPSPRPSRRTQPQPPHYGAKPNPALDAAQGTYTVTVSRDPEASSGEEYDEEQITKIKFKRVSIKRGATRSRSPSPEPGSHEAPQPEYSPSNVSQANGYLAPPGDGPGGQDVDSSAKDAEPTGATGANTDEERTCRSIPSSPVPSISVTSPLAAAGDTISTGSKSGEERDENIDELFASHVNVSPSHSANVSRMDSSSSQKSGNMLSPFSASRESIMSFYSDAGEVNYGKIPVTGDILFGLDYNYKQSIFEIFIKQCKDIAPVDTKKKRSDPYVKTYLLPDKTKNGKRKTRRKKNTLNPTWDEKLTYKINKSELETRTLWVTVWHNDTFGRNDFLGEVTIPLDYYKFGDPTALWYKLEERIMPPEDEDGNPVGGVTMLAYKGDLVVSLKFVTNEHLPGDKKKSKGGAHRGELHVLVKSARNLTAVRSNGSSDPFCKVYLLPERSRNTKQKTHVVKRNCNPEWNHTFTFEDVSWDDLKEKCLELSVWDYDRFSSNDFLGGVRLGCGTGDCAGKAVDWMDSKGEEITVWQNMLDRPNYWIDGTLPLRAKLA